MNDNPPGRARTLAILSFVLGIVSVFLLLLFLGLPAIYFGLQGLRAINAGEGRVRGRFFAVAGMVLGGVATVMLVVGVVALVLVKVNGSAREAACQNNLRIIGTATATYEVKHENYPPGTVLNPRLADPEKRLSWLVEILPNVGAESGSKKQAAQADDLFYKIDMDAAWDDPMNEKAVDTFVVQYSCPGHPERARQRGPARTDFVGLAGIGADAAKLPLRGADRKLNPDVGFFGYDRILRKADVERGTSHTLMAAETARDNGPWAQGGPATVRGFLPQDTPFLGKNGQFGGLRPDGAYMLYADGSVDFFSAQVEVELLRRLAVLSEEGDH